MFEAFSDFSGTQQKNDRLSVACFLYEKSASQKLDDFWKDRLDPILRPLPEHKRFFHMTEFMAHEPPYDLLHMSDGERLSIRHDLIESASKGLEFAAVCHLSVTDYDKEVPEHSHARKLMGGPLAMCGIWALDAISEHLNKKNVPGEIAYFFECGDLGQDELEQRIKQVSASRFYVERYRYGGHAFVPKTKHHALAAADMLAWEYRNGIEEYFKDPEAHRSGPFFEQLFSPPVTALHFSENNIRMRSLSESIQKAKHWARQREEELGNDSPS